MKIAVNTRLLLWGKLEGIGWFAHEVLRRLVERRPNDEFIFYFDRPYDARFVFANNVRPVVLRPQARHPLLYFWWFEVALAKALRRDRAEVFFSPEGLMPLRPPCPTVLAIHDLAIAHFPEQIPLAERLYHRFIVRKAAQRANHIITVSTFSKNDLEHILKINPSKINITYNGCREQFRPLTDTEKRKAQQQYADGSPYFLYVGALHPRKNVERLLLAFDAFKKATNAPVMLLVAGKKAWKTRSLDNAYANLQYRADVRFLGYVAEKELHLLLGGALALTYPSLFEGFGLPVLEALHAEVPVLTSNVSSMPEVAGKAAILVEPQNVRSIAHGMQRLYEDAALREKMIAEGRSQREKFTWDKAVDVVERAMGEVLKQG
jgi:glycosyltransferase involved in cell wall biosynthesis